MRQSQAASQLPSAVNNQGGRPSRNPPSAPLIMMSRSTRRTTAYDGVFLAQLRDHINFINDLMTRVREHRASVSVFGAGNYAMRLWVRPGSPRSDGHHRS